ncbi:hypothetical protein [Kitasatospora sp. NPDC059571]|uniref:hypothetical protein n=1 Tax=Kitasatospora sp. NPDC059571 TaxID=3346871 RepID=UPI0036A8A6FC
MKKFFRLFKDTGSSASDAPFAEGDACRCSPLWPKLETTANGYVLPAEPSSHYSLMTNPEIGPFVARCVACHARYPDPWVIPQGSPMPFAWAQEAEGSGRESG